MVEHEGVEPSFVANQATVLPLDECSILVGVAGIEPALYVPET